MSLLAMSSLYQEREMADTYGAKHKRLTLCATGKLFSEEKIVCTTQCTLFFLAGLFSFANMCAVRYLWTTYVMKHRDKNQPTEFP